MDYKIKRGFTLAAASATASYILACSAASANSGLAVWYVLASIATGAASVIAFGASAIKFFED